MNSTWNLGITTVLSYEVPLYSAVIGRCIIAVIGAFLRCILSVVPWGLFGLIA